MNKTYCDRCKKEIENKIYGIKIYPARLQFNDWLTVDIKFKLKDMDLCSDCMKKLQEFFKENNNAE